MDSRREDLMKKILCVDGEPAPLRVYKDQLSEKGYKVLLAQGGSFFFDRV
jgi:CheY-like chemotaxis protein